MVIKNIMEDLLLKIHYLWQFCVTGCKIENMDDESHINGGIRVAGEQII